MTPLDSLEAVAVSVTYCSECQTTTYAVCSEHGDEHLKIVEAYSDAAVRPLVTAADYLANAASQAACEPRRFYENEGHIQQELAHAIAATRLAIRGLQPKTETE